MLSASLWPAGLRIDDSFHSQVPAPEKLEDAAAAASVPSRAPAVAETLAISLTLRWRPGDGGGASGARRIACRLEAEPCIPAPVLSALQEMLGECTGRYRQLWV